MKCTRSRAECCAEDLYLSVAPGSILGISGVSGNGQDRLFDVLSGEITLPNPDSIMLDDLPIGHMGVEQRRALGMLGAPENRWGTPLSLT